MYGLYPAFTKIFYHTAFASHVRTLPCKAWVFDGSPQGQFHDWVSGVISADTMIKALVNKEKVIVPSTTVFDYYEIWNYPSEDGLPFPVATNSLAIAGTSVATGWSEAVEQTFMLKTTAFGIFKYIILDAVTNNFFGKVLPADFDPAYDDLMAELTAETNGWSGRDNARPSIVKQATITLNDKLRRSYHLT